MSARPESPHHDTLSLAPLEMSSAGEVPEAGRQELIRHQQRRADARSSLWMWLILTGSAVAAAALSEAFIVSCFFLMLASALGFVSLFQFWLLASGRKAWQALPEGATEKTALLEDALTKSLREWNERARRWNRKTATLQQDIRAWHGKAEDCGREDGWSEASHAIEGEALLMAGQALKLERDGLIARRAKLRRSVAKLRDAVRKAEHESRLPEPDDG